MTAYSSSIKTESEVIAQTKYPEMNSDLESWEQNKKHPVDQYTQESNGIGLFLL